MMEADVTKTQQLPNNLPNNPVPVSLHPVSVQGPVLDNHTWKPVDAQDTINHVQEMLEQISARGVHSMLVTVGPFGEIGIHGSQKGQLFLKENSDIGDRFAKICTDVIELAGTQRQEEFDISNDSDNYIPEYDEDTDCDDHLLTDEKPVGRVRSVIPAQGKGVSVTDKTVNTRSAKKAEVFSDNTKTRNSVVKEVKSRKLVTGANKHVLKINVKLSNADSKRSLKREIKSPLKKINNGATSDKTTDKTSQDEENIQTLKFTETLPTPVNRTYSCKRCDEPFPSTTAHNKHLRSKACFIKNKYDEETKYVLCKQCKLTFPRQDYLEVHRAVHEESVPRNFNVMFLDLSKQICDIENDEYISQLKCQHCGQNFAEKRLLLHHTITMHGMSFECQLCEEQCETKHKCWSHQRTHENQNVKSVDKGTFHCRTCPMTFKSKTEMDKHDLSCHSDGQVVFHPCDQCKKVFSSNTFLEQHKLNVHGNKYVCSRDGCKKGFSSSDKLEQHSVVHEERSFMCSFCGKLFNNRGNFHIHLRIHENERKFECDVCDKTFKTKDVLSKHKRIHSDTRPFCCEICGWGFNQSGSLKKHMESHLNIKRYQCNVCNQKFANKASLTNHKLLRNHFVAGDSKDTEDIVKAKKCEYCDKLFPPGSMYMYKRHVIIHTGVKPHTCDFCGKSFCDKSNLRYHRLTHTENKPFSCPVCGRGFIQKRGLRKHIEGSTSCSISSRKASKHLRQEETVTETTVSAFHRPTLIAAVSDTTETVTAPSSTGEDVVQRQEPMNFQEIYSAEAIGAAMVLAGTDQDEISRAVTDLSNNISTGDTAWMYVKQWK